MASSERVATGEPEKLARRKGRAGISAAEIAFDSGFPTISASTLELRLRRRDTSLASSFSVIPSSGCSDRARRALFNRCARFDEIASILLATGDGRQSASGTAMRDDEFVRISPEERQPHAEAAKPTIRPDTSPAVWWWLRSDEKLLNACYAQNSCRLAPQLPVTDNPARPPTPVSDRLLFWDSDVTRTQVSNCNLPLRWLALGSGEAT